MRISTLDPKPLCYPVLIDIARVLIGDGIRLFGQKGMEPVRLEKTEISEAGQITNVRFRFAG